MRGEMNSYWLRFYTGVKTSSVHMKFHFGCIWKRPDILMDISFRVVFTYFIARNEIHFCQNDRYEIHTRNDVQTHMRIKRNIQRLCADSFCFGQILFTQNLMPVRNFILVKMIDMKSMLFWVSFRLNLCEHK